MSRVMGGVGSVGLVLVGMAFPSPSAAQTDPGSIDPETMRAYLVDAFERNRAMDLAYLQAAPDSMLRWAPTPGVRDFAQQLAHTTHNFFAPWRGVEAPDSAAYLNDRAALESALVGAYDWAVDRLGQIGGDELLEELEIYGGRTAPLWRVMQYWLDHAMWTRGSLIPYLRLNGVEPPAVQFW